MSRYRKVEARTWSDGRFRSLSKIAPSGQGLWLFLLTGPCTGPIPGLFKAGRAAMAEELGWSQEAFDEAFLEVSEQGMAVADFEARLMWLPNSLRYNKPESPNVVRSWRTELDLLPECELKRRAIESMREALGEFGSSYVEALNSILEDTPYKKHRKTSSKPSSKPLANTTPNQEQEQEQEQEERESGISTAVAAESDLTTVADAPSKTKTPRGSRLPDGWVLPKSWGEWSVSELGMSPESVRSEADRFADYWHAKAGRDATKADWPATWRNWCRNAKPAGGPVSGRSGRVVALSTDDRDAEAMRLLGIPTSPDGLVVEVT